MSKDKEDQKDNEEEVKDDVDESKVDITQDKLNTELASARRKGQEQGKKAFLKELGLDGDTSVEDIKAQLEAVKAAEDANKTALELAEGKVSELEKAQANITKQAEMTINRAINLLVVSAVKEAALNLEEYKVVPEALGDVTTMIQADKKLSELIVFDEDTSSITGATEAVEALIKAKPYLAQKRGKEGPGTTTLPRVKTDDSPGNKAPEKPLVKF
jgi:hypothetical protein